MADTGTALKLKYEGNNKCGPVIVEINELPACLKGCELDPLKTRLIKMIYASGNAEDAIQIDSHFRQAELLMRTNPEHIEILEMIYMDVGETSAAEIGVRFEQVLTLCKRECPT